MFNLLFFKPILNLMVFLYNTIPGNDLGVVIIVLTIIIRLLLYPLSKNAIKSQKQIQEVQPIINQIKIEYKDNKEELNKKVIELYKERKINPFSSCLPLLIQIPFFIAVYQVFQVKLETISVSQLYSFIHLPTTINYIAFGFLDLSVKNFYIAILAGIAQYWQVKMINKKNINQNQVDANDISAIMNKQMMYFFPVLIMVISMTLPAGLAFYLLVSSLFTIGQQYWIYRND